MSKLIYHKADSPSIIHLCNCDEVLRGLIRNIGNISYTLENDYFRFFVNTIISQMLSTKVADVIFGRLNYLLNNEISPDRFKIITISDLRKLGLSEAKAGYILNLAQQYQDNQDYFNNFESKTDDEVITELTKLRGIGIWSAKMFLIFVLDRQDILPFEDGAFKQSFKYLYPEVGCNKENMINQCSRWSPYSSIASRYLYKALDSGLTKVKSNI